MRNPEAAAVLHQLTKHGSPILDRSRLVDFLPLDPSNRPAPFKRFPRLETRPLPADRGPWSGPTRATGPAKTR